VRREADITGTREGEYLKDTFNELESNSKDKKHRALHKGITEFNKCYQSTDMVKYEKGDLLVVPHKILNRRKLITSATE
jgi:hypothetical protein